MQRGVALYLVQMLLIIHRRSDDLAWIGYGAQELKLVETQDRRRGSERADSLGDLVQVFNEDVMGGQRIAVAKQSVQSRGYIADVGTLHQPQPAFPESAQPHNQTPFAHRGAGSLNLPSYYTALQL
jgi:hypothetical protein